MIFCIVVYISGTSQGHAHLASGKPLCSILCTPTSGPLAYALVPSAAWPCPPSPLGKFSSHQNTCMKSPLSWARGNSSLFWFCPFPLIEPFPCTLLGLFLFVLCPVCLGSYNFFIKPGHLFSCYRSGDGVEQLEGTWKLFTPHPRGFPS